MLNSVFQGLIINPAGAQGRFKRGREGGRKSRVGGGGGGSVGGVYASRKRSTDRVQVKLSSKSDLAEIQILVTDIREFLFLLCFDNLWN